MAWGKAGSTTLASTGDTLTTTGMTASIFNQFLFHTLASGNADTRYKYNSTDQMALRYSQNGGSDATSTSDTPPQQIWVGYGDHFNVNYMANISGEEKLVITFDVTATATGAGTAPARMESVHKSVQSDQITEINISNGGSGDYLTDSNLTVLGSDMTPAAAIVFAENAQTGSRAEITDSRKMYSLNLSSNVTQITDGSHTVLQFTGDATFTPASSFNVETIVVAGGGGSGGGGGGAGGIVYDAVKAVTAQSYTITVGAGGDGGSNSYNGTAGEDSVFDNITANGGGFGAKDNTNGGSGGSGGGGGATSINVGAGGSATQTASGGDTGYGNAGGSFGNNSAPHPNGGGGGAGAVGGNGSGSTCGSGGVGIVNPISGSTIGELSSGSYYLGGGGGGGRSGLTQGSGGLGGGGNGSASTGENGTANTGGGGGGSFGNTSTGNGGSGVVILRFLTSGNSWSANEWQEIGT